MADLIPTTRFVRRRTMEKHLDAGIGSAPRRDPRAAEILVDAFTNPESDDVSFLPFTVMPNHGHALVVPRPGHHIELHPLIARLKGRTARAINLAIGRSGGLWQREWFDRWVRSDAEWERLVAYIKNNPVQARLVEPGCVHPWTR